MAKFFPTKMTFLTYHFIFLARKEGFSAAINSHYYIYWSTFVLVGHCFLHLPRLNFFLFHTVFFSFPRCGFFSAT